MMSDRDVPPAERARQLENETTAPADDLLARLPSQLRGALAAIAAAVRGAFGRTTTQRILDGALPTLEELYAIGAEHRDVALVLHALGIRDARGQSLSIGTISSAIHRARLKRAAAELSFAVKHHQNGERSEPPSVRPEARCVAASTSLVKIFPAHTPATQSSPPARAPPIGGPALAETTNFLNSIRTDDDD